MKELTNWKAPLTMQELVQDAELAFKNDKFKELLNNPPPSAWITNHPTAKDVKYLPIDKVEFMMDRIFQQWKVEILKSGQVLNALEVTVRVHYLHPVTGEWHFHDGIGAKELQTSKGSGVLKLDLSNLVHGAIEKALPTAKSSAIKDACDHLGKLFGRDLNRKNTINYSTSYEAPDQIRENLAELFEIKKDSLTSDFRASIQRVLDNSEVSNYSKSIKMLKTA